MKYAKKFDRFCQRHEDLVAIIGGIISLIVLKMAGAF